MRVFGWAALCSPAVCMIVFAAELTTVESGTFLLFQAGKQIGRELYLHQREGNQEIWSATAELDAGGVQLKQQPRLVTTSDGRPVSFDLIFSTGGPEQSLNYGFADQTLTVTRKGPSGEQSEERPMPANAVILSNNIIHHNLLLARRYDWAKGGRQEFNALPNTPVALEGRGEEEFRNGGAVLKLRHLFLSIGGVIGANLWLDSKGQLIKMDIPLQRAEIFMVGFEKIEPVPNAEPVPRAAIDASDVTFPSGDHTMAGTLTRPKSRPDLLPALILITGSGPQNRDEDSVGAGGLKLGLFRVIAEKLSGNGMAVLRYDDRGIGQSGGNFATSNMTDFEDDARAAIAYLKTRPEIDPRRIGIVGHSEGAILGARIAASLPDVKVLVSLAGTARNGEAILRWQSQRALSKMNLKQEELKAAADKQERFFEAVKNAEADVTEIEGQNVNVRWFKEFLIYDPLATMRRVKCAVAIVQGERDVQVPPEDARLLDQALMEAGNQNHILRIFPTLGHLFTESTGDGIAELADSQKKISPEVLEFIADFLRKKL